MAKLYKSETGSRISYGTLYTTFRRMQERGWVTVTEDSDADGRVRFFLITASGLRAFDRSRASYSELGSLRPATGASAS